MDETSLSRGWRIAAILSLTVIATAIAVNLSSPYPMDFISYWAAAKLALGRSAASAYDIAAHHDVQAGAVAEPTLMPFPYPPPFLLLLLPFGSLPFPWSAAIWILSTLALYVAVVRRLMPGIGAVAIAFPSTIFSGVIGQNGFLTAAFFIGAMLALPRRPVVAGLLVACLAIKPQLGVLIPLALIAAREWRAFAAAAIGVSLLSLAGLSAFGMAAWKGFIALLPMYGSIAADGLVGWHKMASVHAALMLAGAPDWLATGVHAAFAVVGACLVWRVWRSTDDRLTRGAALAIGSILVSPYLYVYDQLILIVAIAFMLRAGASQALIAALMLLPLTTLVQTSLPDPRLNLAPMLPIILLVLTWRAVTARNRAPCRYDSLPAPA